MFMHNIIDLTILCAVPVPDWLERNTNNKLVGKCKEVMDYLLLMV